MFLSDFGKEEKKDKEEEEEEREQIIAVACRQRSKLSLAHDWFGSFVLIYTNAYAILRPSLHRLITHTDVLPFHYFKEWHSFYGYGSSLPIQS